ncbi:MAG: GNAT family N-acetyltransferase [Rhodopirellula sp. JB053]
MTAPTLRNAIASQDAGAIRQIYAHYVLHSSATFEEVPPTVSAMQQSIEYVHDRQLPFIVAEFDGRIVGYCSAKPFYGRSGFFPSVENSIFIAPHFAGRGLGSMLMRELIKQCQQRSLMNIIALIGGGDANSGSTRLHEKFGFRRVGQIENCGRKIGEYCSMSIYQLILPSEGEPERTA